MAATKGIAEVRAGDWVQDWDGQWREVYDVMRNGVLYHLWLKGAPAERALKTFRRGDAVPVQGAPAAPAAGR